MMMINAAVQITHSCQWWLKIGTKASFKVQFSNFVMIRLVSWLKNDMIRYTPNSELNLIEQWCSFMLI